LSFPAARAVCLNRARAFKYPPRRRGVQTPPPPPPRLL